MLPTSSQKMSVLRKLVGYVLSNRPGILGTTLVGVVSSGIEVIAMASLIPISILASNQQILPRSLWYRMPAAMGFEPNVKFYTVAFIALLSVRTASSTYLPNTHRTFLCKSARRLYSSSELRKHSKKFDRPLYCPDG